MSQAQESMFIERHAMKRGFLGPLRRLYYLTDHRVRLQTKNYTLGFVWWFLDPLVNTAILYLVTTVILGSRTSSLAMFLLSGLLTYRFLQASISGACSSLAPALSLSSRLYVTKYVFVVRDVAAQLMQFLIGIGLIIVMLFFLGQANIKPIALIYVIFVAAVFALASASVVSLVSMFIKDVRVVIGYMFRALFFLSGTFFGLDRVPEEWRTVFLMNPFALLMHEMRGALILTTPMNYGMLTGLLAVSLLVGAVGFFFLWKFDRVLPKYA